MIYRIFVEKKDNLQAKKVKEDVKNLLKIEVEDVRELIKLSRRLQRVCNRLFNGAVRPARGQRGAVRSAFNTEGTPAGKVRKGLRC